MGNYSDDELLQLSGLQHFAFCRRQWALIHIENQWRGNLRTVEGDLFHSRAHDEAQRERRGDTLILRGLPSWSYYPGVLRNTGTMEIHSRYLAFYGTFENNGTVELWENASIRFGDDSIVSGTGAVVQKN